MPVPAHGPADGLVGYAPPQNRSGWAPGADNCLPAGAEVGESGHPTSQTKASRRSLPSAPLLVRVRDHGAVRHEAGPPGYASATKLVKRYR
jgi:hypothetical protein